MAWRRRIIRYTSRRSVLVLQHASYFLSIKKIHWAFLGLSGSSFEEKAGHVGKFYILKRLCASQLFEDHLRSARQNQYSGVSIMGGARLNWAAIRSRSKAVQPLFERAPVQKHWFLNYKLRVKTKMEAAGGNPHSSETKSQAATPCWNCRVRDLLLGITAYLCGFPTKDPQIFHLGFKSRRPPRQENGLSREFRNSLKLCEWRDFYAYIKFGARCPSWEESLW